MLADEGTLGRSTDARAGSHQTVTSLAAFGYLVWWSRSTADLPVADM